MMFNGGMDLENIVRSVMTKYFTFKILGQGFKPLCRSATDDGPSFKKTA